MVPPPRLLLLAMTVIVGILLSVIAFILIYLLRERNLKSKRNSWRQQMTDLLQKAIYFEPGTSADSSIPIPFKTARMLKWSFCRQMLIDELVKAKKSLSGAAAVNLGRLFNQLGLHADAEHKLRSRQWHLQAQGIQELAILEQRQALTRIYRFTNNRNELVRREAQTAVVQLYGFDGLRFLDIIDHPVTEWQQIKLLRLLSRSPGVVPAKIRNWLSSANDTVIQFALKLVAEHHHQEVHEKVIRCLQHPSAAVRRQAILCLRDVYSDTTAAVLSGTYPDQPNGCRLMILETLSIIGSEEEIPFLIKQLEQHDDMLRLAAARALANLGTEGIRSLAVFPLADTYPWNEIIRHAINERVA